MATDTSEAEILEAASHLSNCRSCGLALDRASDETQGFFRALQGEVALPPRYDPCVYSAALETVMDRLSEESSRLDGERITAPRLLEELEKYPPSRQHLIVRNSRRFQNWGFAENLLEECQRLWAEEPERGENFGLLACEVVESLRVNGFREKVANDLKSEAWTYIANCRRLRGDAGAALQALDRAEGFLLAGTGDALERARFSEFKAALLRQQERFSDARRLLELAVSIYHAAGEKHLEARALLGFGKLYGDMGEADAYLPVVERAIRLLREDGDHHLGLIAQMQLLHYLTECDRLAEASALLPSLRVQVSSYGTRLDQLRLFWNEGRLCQALQQFGLAEELLKQSREGFATAGKAYDVALVSMDLAAVYLETGRTKEVKEMACEVVPQFIVQQIHGDALAAIALFEQAARKERATLALVQEVASKVRDCQGRRAPSKG